MPVPCKKEMLRARRLKKRRELRKASPAQMAALRAKFINQAKKYFGYPYARKYWPPESEEYHSKLFLDCCGLVRQVLRDLSEDFGFVIGPWNQAYMFDTLPIVVQREEDMKPGDLVFVSATYCNPKSKKQPHNMTHVEIWAGDGPKTIGARWNNGKVQVWNHYKFAAKSYHSETYHFRSIETWLRGICKSFCSQHRWKRRVYCPKKKSIFALPPQDEQQTEEGKKGENSIAEGENCSSDGNKNGSEDTECDGVENEDDQDDEEQEEEFDGEEDEAAEDSDAENISCQEEVEEIQAEEEEGEATEEKADMDSIDESPDTSKSSSCTSIASASDLIETSPTESRNAGKKVDSKSNGGQKNGKTKNGKKKFGSQSENKPKVIHKSSSDSNIKSKKRLNRNNNARPHSQPVKSRKRESTTPEDLCQTFHTLNMHCPDQIGMGSPILHTSDSSGYPRQDQANTPIISPSIGTGSQSRTNTPGAS